MAGTHRITQLGRALCLGGAGLGVVVLVGWLIGMPQLAIIVPGLPPMMPNTALCMAALGIGGALRAREHASVARSALAIAAALLALAIGVGTVAEYALQIRTGLDQFFIPVSLGAAVHFPGRPSPPTAVAISLLAAGILFFDTRRAERVRLPEWMILAAAIIAVTALFSQLFGAEALYRLTRMPVIGVSLPTAVALLMISSGLLLERSESGVMRLLLGHGPGSALLLRLAPVAILVPVAFGLVAARLLELPGIASIASDIAIIFAVLTGVTSLASLFLLSITAIRLNKTYEALEQAQARARALFDQAPEGIFIANLDGRYTDANEAACRMLGYSRDEIIGKTIMDLIEPDERKRLDDTREQQLKGAVDVGEWALRHKDGTRIPTEVSASILPDRRWQAFVRDITKRKRAEEALRLSEAKFSGIVSLSADAIVSIGEDRRITLFNAGAEKIFGRPASETIGEPLDILIPERFRAAHRQYVESFAAGSISARHMGGRNANLYGLRRNGEEFPADAAISKLAVGGTSILTVSLRDTTEERRTQNEQRLLAEAGSLLAGTLDLESTLTSVARLAVRELAAVCIIDFVGDDGKMRRLRAACHDPAKDWICRAIAGEGTAEAPLSPVAMNKIGRSLLVQEATVAVLGNWVSSADQLKALQAVDPGSAMLVPLQRGGKHSGVLSLISSRASPKYGPRDLVFAEAIARLAGLSIEKAVLYRTAMRATRARDDLLGIVAHDLRNPLQVISANAHVLNTYEPEELAEAGVEITQSVRRMDRLIQDLLDVTRMEAGQLSLMPERIAPHEIVRDLIESQETLAASAGLAIEADVSWDLPEVWADRDRLSQILENVVGNAIKFSKPGDRISLGARADGNQIVFSVIDTGAGIAKADLDHIFDRFWQADKATRKGTGLGLPIVKALVQAHGGEVRVESTLGKGTSFFFSIPIAAAAKSQDCRTRGTAAS